jgi:RimJ/RimL family protein N-acetyltransferase
MGKLGMRQEGHLRETRRWQGGWADEVVFSLLDREFEK